MAEAPEVRAMQALHRTLQEIADGIGVSLGATVRYRRGTLRMGPVVRKRAAAYLRKEGNRLLKLAAELGRGGAP